MLPGVMQLNEALEMGLKRGRREGQRAAPGWNEKLLSKNNLKSKKCGSLRVS